MKHIKLKLPVLIGVAAVLVAGIIVAYLFLEKNGATKGISSVSMDNTWFAKLAEPTVSGVTYSLSDQLNVGVSTRFTSTSLPEGWHVTEDSGSGGEAAVYNLAANDKQTVVKTTNLASALAGQYDTVSKCTQELTERYTSSEFLVSYIGATEGSVVSGAYTTYVVATADGNGIEMGRVDYSYKDKDGAMQYATRLIRCSTGNILSVTITGPDQKAEMDAVTEIFKYLVVKL